MKHKKITIIKDYSPAPYGRYSKEVEKGEEDSTGERFRKEILTPALHKYDTVHVDLSGYNRYARSFIDEAFGGLISSDGFTLQELTGKLTYSHSDLPSICGLIRSRMENAEKHRHEHD